MASFATIAVETLAGGAREALCVSRSLHQHQMSVQSIAGASHGGRPGQALVADYQEQDWPAICGAGIKGADAPNLLNNWRGLMSASFSRISHRVALPSLAQSFRPVECSSRSIGHNSPAARHCAERGAFNTVRVAACKRSHAHILPVEQVFQGIANRDHLSSLSSVSVLWCSHNASRRGQGFGHVTQPLDHLSQELGASIQANRRRHD